MSEKLPHEDYITAVTAALTSAGLTPDSTEIESPAGERLYGVLIWEGGNRSLNQSEWPHGVLVSWTQLDGWEYVRPQAGSSNGWPMRLLREFHASPNSVVAAVRMLLRGPDGLPIGGTLWDGSLQLTRDVNAWCGYDDE